MRKLSLCFLICLIVMLLVAGVRLEMRGRTAMLYPVSTAGTQVTEPTEPPEINPFTDSLATVKVPNDTFDIITDLDPPNNELQDYLPQQVSIDNGRIVITADKTEDGYVSGMAVSRMAFQYGTFAFRVSTVRGDGLFPAVWMLPAEDKPLPEIDIYELIGSRYDRFYGVLHTMDQDGLRRKYSFQKFVDDVELPPFYVIKVRWAPDELVWYINDEPIYTITDYIPQQPMYLIFNLAVGGNWPGNPTADTVFPNQFIVDILQFDPEIISIR